MNRFDSYQHSLMNTVALGGILSMRVKTCVAGMAYLTLS